MTQHSCREQTESAPDIVSARDKHQELRLKPGDQDLEQRGTDFPEGYSVSILRICLDEMYPSSPLMLYSDKKEII